MAGRKSKSRFDENVVICKNWAELASEFDALPKPVWRRDEEGEAYRQGWIFRGHKSECHALQPSIERARPYCDWAEAE